MISSENKTKDQLLKIIHQFKKKSQELEDMVELQQDVIAQQKETITQQKETISQQKEAITQQGENIKELGKQIALLTKQFGMPDAEGNLLPASQTQKTTPDWVKPNKAKSDGTKSDGTEPDGKKKKKTRKLRAVHPTFKRREPNGIEEYYYDRCPDCQGCLTKGTEYSRRQVIEIPPILVQIIDPILYQQYCGRCEKKLVKPVDFTQITGGNGHYGLNLISLIAYLRVIGRMAIETIQNYLQAHFQAEISVGEITELLHRTAEMGKPVYEQFHKQIKSASYLHADETGWREDGINGYIWSFSTHRTRYFAYYHSRGSVVPSEILGADYRGILVSDFYSSYNYYLGEHQRCWVHYLRDLKDLEKEYSTNKRVCAWIGKVRALYKEAKLFSSSDRKLRVSERLCFEKKAVALGTPYQYANLPQSTLAKRLINFEKELFTFVEYPEVPSDNNAAERSIRPCVTFRKMCGGTRSEKGSKTAMVLMSLFHTWHIRAQDTMQNCKLMLMGNYESLLLDK